MSVVGDRVDERERPLAGLVQQRADRVAIQRLDPSKGQWERMQGGHEGGSGILRAIAAGSSPTSGCWRTRTRHVVRFPRGHARTLSEKGRRGQFVLAVVIPALFGAIAGWLLGVNEIAYLVFGLVVLVGAYVAGLEHRRRG